MSKTQELIALVEAGTHRISPHTQTHVEKWRGQPYGWTTVGGWRIDVVRRAAFHFYLKGKAQRERDAELQRLIFTDADDL